MKATISFTQVQEGRPRVGYYDWRTVITFTYPPIDDTQWGAGKWAEDKEREIVHVLTGPPSHSMWYDASVTDHVWTVRHGYDSGD